MGSSFTKEEKEAQEIGSAIKFPKIEGDTLRQVDSCKMTQLAFVDGVFAEVIKDSNKAVKDLVKKTPVGVADLLHAKRATDAYIDLRDQIAEMCHQKKGIFQSGDHWDSHKINALVEKHKPEFQKCGVQVHFNQFSYWHRHVVSTGTVTTYYYAPTHIRWVVFADAKVDPKSCTQYVFDPVKIYDPPAPKSKKFVAFNNYNKENMKLVEAGHTHFPKDHATYLLYSNQVPRLPKASAEAVVVATVVEDTAAAASTADPADLKAETS